MIIATNIKVSIPLNRVSSFKSMRQFDNGSEQGVSIPLNRVSSFKFRVVKYSLEKGLGWVVSIPLNRVSSFKSYEKGHLCTSYKEASFNPLKSGQ